MQQWLERFKCLWIIFQHSNGLPTWHDGTMNAAAPELPALGLRTEQRTGLSQRGKWVDFTFSIGTANVNALSRGPDGYAGKLHYLQDQMRALKLNCVAVQEA